MKILVTGARGFVGKNLCATLNNIAQGKDRSFAIRPDITVWECDIDTPQAELDAWCADCDFVFHLAGVNRPQREEEFMEGNFGVTSRLLQLLEKHGNSCPVMLSSSVQAAYDNPYGRSKLAGEQLLRDYGARSGARVLIYRFSNLFGKWCRPNYNSVVATFCYQIARGLPIHVNDPATELDLVYIDDAVAELICAMNGKPHMDGETCCVPAVHRVTLDMLAELLHSFRAAREKREIPDLSDDFTRKLYATYLSYLPEREFSYPLTTHSDKRGSFTEIFRTADRGQISVNVSKPHEIKGNHWHHTKNEKFLVVSGRGIIRLRRIDSAEVLEYDVSAENLEVVEIPTGYTHNIENLGDSDMVTLMWASECFNPEKPDTYSAEV